MIDFKLALGAQRIMDAVLKELRKFPEFQSIEGEMDEDRFDS